MKSRLLYIAFFYFLLGCKAQPGPDCEYKGKPVDFILRVGCPDDFNYIKGKPLTEKFGRAESIKIVYSIKDKKVYFINSTRFPFHFDFCVNVLRENDDLEYFNKYNYNENSKREFVLSNLNYYSSVDVYALEFMAEDDISGAHVAELYKLITERTWFNDKIKVLVSSPEMQQRWSNQSLPFIDADEIYKGRNYVSLNKGITYGYIRKVDIKQFDKYSFDKHDLVILNGLPNQLPVVSGVLTVPFQTPLCHISLLCQNRGTPNASYRNAWTDKHILDLENKLVRYEVNADTFLLSVATDSEAIAFWKKTEDRKPIQLSIDTTRKQILGMADLSFKNVSLVGGKAANFSELMKIKVDSKGLPLPEGAFAIPFYFYFQHLHQHNILSAIDSVINDPFVLNDPAKLDAALKLIRNRIRDAALDKGFLQAVIKKLNENGDEFVNYRFRSSTNAEDVKGFNGAGLYESKTGSLTDKEKPVEKAIKAVWASLWDERAFAERQYFKIDQHTVAMGLLVHRAFGEELSNGVAITKHMYRKDYPAYTINVQIGEISVVNPPDSVTCDEAIISLGDVTGLDKIAVEYIGRSSLSKIPILTLKQLEELTKYLTAIKDHFFYKVEKVNRFFYRDFGMDVEFKIDAHTGNLYIKQARSL